VADLVGDTPSRLRWLLRALICATDGLWAEGWTGECCVVVGQAELGLSVAEVRRVATAGGGSRSLPVLERVEPMSEDPTVAVHVTMGRRPAPTAGLAVPGTRDRRSEQHGHEQHHAQPGAVC